MLCNRHAYYALAGIQAKVKTGVPFVHQKDLRCASIHKIVVNRRGKKIPVKVLVQFAGQVLHQTSNGDEN